MKRYLQITLILCLILSLYGCQSEKRVAEHWEEQYHLGEQSCVAGDYQAAIEQFTAAIEIDPERAEAYAARGNAYFCLALFQESMSDFQAAIEKQPDIEYYLRLENVFLAQNDLDAAIDVLENCAATSENAALQAKRSELAYASKVHGNVYLWNAGEQNTPASGAVVSLWDMNTGAFTLCYKTDSTGSFEGYILPGTYEVLVQLEGYRSVVLNWTIDANTEEVIMQDILLIAEEDGLSGGLNCTIFDAGTGEPIEGATIVAKAGPKIEGLEYPEEAVLSDWGNGYYANTDLPVGYYTLTVTYDGYKESTIETVVNSRSHQDYEIQLEQIHFHTWAEANYQSPTTCTVCGVTVGDPLTPDFVKYGINANMQVGKIYSYVTVSSSSRGIETEGTATVLDYKIVSSDDTHEARDGYEWRIATFQEHFADANAAKYGVHTLDFRADYYDLATEFNIDAIYSDNHNFLAKMYINYYGTETEIITKKETLSGSWSNSELNIVFRVSYQVPIGYDGCCYCISHSAKGLELIEEDVFLWNDTYYTKDLLIFRFD